MTILFDGIASGMLLFLISVGLSVTLGLMNFVNLAHGAFAMIGGYACVVLLNDYGVPFLATLPFAVLVPALVGIVLERTLYRRLYAASDLDQVLFSLGLVFMAVAAAHYFFGAQQQPLHLPDFLKGQIHLPGLDVGVYRLFLVIVGLAVAFGLQWSVVKTAFGARLRAAVDNQRVARGMGIDVSRVFSLTFALGSALASDGERLLSLEERAAIEARLQEVAASAQGTDAPAIRRAIEELERACAAYVERRMNAGIQQVMAGHRLQEFDDPAQTPAQ
jgi:branched-chain amino acid transport system permease protein